MLFSLLFVLLTALIERFSVSRKHNVLVFFFLSVLVVAPQTPPPPPSKTVKRSKLTVRLSYTFEGGGRPL